MSNFRSLAYYATAYTASSAVHKGLGFALLMWLASVLPMGEYARFGLLFGLQSILSTLAAAGIVEAVTGLLKEARTPPARLELFGVANTVFVVLSVGTIGLVIPIYAAFFKGDSGSAHELAFVVLGGIVSAFIALQAALARLEERHPASLVLSTCAPIGALVAGFIGARSDRSASAYFAGAALVLLASLPAFRLCGLRFHLRVGTLGKALPVLIAASPFLLIGLLNWVVSYGNTYLLKSFFAAGNVALFTFALTLSSVMHMVATSMNQVWVPRFLQLMHELPPEQLEIRNRKFHRLQGAALGLVGGIVLAVVPLAIDLIGGQLSAYRGMSLELFLLFSAYAVSIPWWQSQSYYLGYGRGKDLMKITIWTSALGMLLWVLAVLVLGLLGCYVGFLLYMLTRSVWAAVSARREWSMHAAWEGVAAALLPLMAGASASILLPRVTS